MNVEDYKRLKAYYAAAKSLKSQIEHIEKILHGVRYRTKDGCKSFRIFIQRADGNGRDQGCHATIPEYVFRDAIVPALAESLKGLREDLKALPPVRCVDEKEHEKRKTTSK
jgi:hypothetical protein